ncbi:Rac prophage; putative DNA-binding transcriptional regulator [Escherichia coli]|nr:Rac prophage; putative DNA-binding transcriptional regulator [Escherichia coli]SQP64802.1 Rac prophage; putative DNA-binding transcriptional regulator [Escherichia coli]SQZ54259.1 Rac prophage; putative DNA-binding transcriptional regulator [Escherichia coli]SQZ86605.1 Rac prophage; putative DNA-binding transcriptional regulator [Escherichia coli]STE21350.1 Rac prophage; putative DNA-binding transcriptional regulator [Escherichia coli]
MKKENYSFKQACAVVGGQAHFSGGGSSDDSVIVH